MLIRDEKVKN